MERIPYGTEILKGIQSAARAIASTTLMRQNIFVEQLQKSNLLYWKGKWQRRGHIPPVKNNHILISLMETGVWPRQIWERSRMIKK